MSSIIAFLKKAFNLSNDRKSPSEEDDSGWVIVNTMGPEMKCVSLDLGEGPYDWVTDLEKATKFSRKEDAELLAVGHAVLRYTTFKNLTLSQKQP